MGTLSGMKKWAAQRGSAIRAEQEDAKAGKKKEKIKGAAKHTYENRTRGIKSQIITPGSRVRHSDSVKNTIRYAYNQDGSRVRFHQEWLDDQGKGHSTRQAARDASSEGFLPHIHRYTR